jgi:drug/metabolite transporter (DMT)-like permease
LTAYTFSMLVVIASQVAYQLAVKSVPPAIPPLGMLATVYALAAVACIVLAPLVGSPIVLADLRSQFGWPMLLLSVSIVGIELGYLFAYRNGWTLGVTYSVASTATVTILAIVGVLWFGDTMNIRRAVGLVVALAGGWLVVAPV